MDFSCYSCLPNSVLIFEGRMAVVRALHHIPKGTEVIHCFPNHFGQFDEFKFSLTESMSSF